jgi:hypothetical protein
MAGQIFGQREIQRIQGQVSGRPPTPWVSTDPLQKKLFLFVPEEE